MLASPAICAIVFLEGAMRTFDSGERDPMTIKRVALKAAGSYRKAILSLE
jgi:hypothetical protein